MTRCKHCGKETKEPALFPVEGTSYAVDVCPECDYYLSKNDHARGRFVLLVRAEDKLAQNGVMPEFSKKNERRTVI